jgi:hypothetical protein
MATVFKRMDALKISAAAFSLVLPVSMFGAAAAAPPATPTAPAPARAATPATPAGAKAPNTSVIQPKGAAAKEKEEEELNEVTISAEKPTRKVADLIPFLRRILGQYTVDGKVDLGGQGKPEDKWTAVGTGNCVGFGVAPGVQCELKVKWPQIPGPNGEAAMSGIMGMEPMMILYGLEPDELGIRYLQVNNKGLAEGTTGFMINDTVTFKTPCVNTGPGCQRVTRVTARSDSKVVDFVIDTEIDYKVAARFNFKLRRVANPQAELVRPKEDDPKAPAPPTLPAKATDKAK